MFILALQLILQNTYPISGTYVKDRHTAASVGRGLFYYLLRGGPYCEFHHV